ncbi:MAG: peptidylprolyl isomerase [Brevinematales bacterium]|nr:peptidylprolyl isomerase [Brevinematales bacterium]
MKHKLIGLVFIVFAGVLAGGVSGCSSPGIAGIVKNGSVDWIVTGDTVHDDMERAALKNGNAIVDIRWLKNGIFERYILPELAYLEMMDAGITNQPDFTPYYDREMKKLYWVLLYETGMKLETGEIQQGNYPAVRISHILIDVPAILKKKGIAPEDAAQTEEYWKQAFILATNMIGKMQSSPTQKQLFENYARMYSQDPLTSENGGDIGYIIEGMTVPEFETSIFAKKTAGLLAEPVKTQYGYHIIYVTDPAKPLNWEQIKSVTGGNFQQFQKNLQNVMKGKQIKELFSIYAEKKGIVIDGVPYTPELIPDYTPVVKIWGREYAWKECKDLIEIFTPGFVKNLTLDSFLKEMKSLRNFLYFAGLSYIKGEQNKQEFIKELAKQKDEWIKTYCVDNLKTQLYSTAYSKVEPKDVLSYYEKSKSLYVSTNGVVTFESVSNTIYKTMAQEKYNTLYTKWQTNSIEKYGLIWNEEALKNLRFELEAAVKKQGI